MTKRKDIHFRIEEKLLERFESAIHNGIWRDPKTLAIYRCQKEKS
ncbi:TPA: hypothetical protein ACQUNC_001392 [Bacillus paranthracis]|nr:MULTISPECIES: hypothetical protein [Bacillus]MDA1583858.1 hypothetical protein [Bacillus cereus group sp. TH230-1LC]